MAKRRKQLNLKQGFGPNCYQFTAIVNVTVHWQTVLCITGAIHIG
jgi:hypothetical protein